MELLLLIIKSLIIFVYVLMFCVAYIIWVERKVLGHMQGRLGPMHTGFHGLLQPIADILKCVLKEDILPTAADKIVFVAAPIMAILFFLAVGLGLVARTVPQMNVFIVGFPLQIGVGLIMIALSMPFFSIIIRNEISQLPAQLVGLMGTF